MSENDYIMDTSSNDHSNEQVYVYIFLGSAIFLLLLCILNQNRSYNINQHNIKEKVCFQPDTVEL
jgi:hypothetical protein